MLNLESIVKQYPQRLQGFKENILKEHLQYRILEIIYGSKFADRLIFMGGTAIRVVHQGPRFSEDLDFDNQGLTEKAFDSVAETIRRELALDGYSVEIRNVFKGAYHCYIRFPGLLYAQGLSGHMQERILVRIDAQPQDYEYTPDNFLINRFGLFRYINTVPAPLLLAQKFYACLNRERAQGRDFFDVVFLASITDADFSYLAAKAGIATKEALIESLNSRVKEINLKALARDVEPFLFEASQKSRVELFAQWLRDWARTNDQDKEGPYSSAL